MENKEKNIRAVDGTKLYVRTWKPNGITTAHLFLIHGFSEHSGRYEAWIKRFVENNIKVSTMDLRGHGRSSGRRGHTPTYNHLLDDIETLIKHEGLENDVPRFLYGQSLGGSLVLNYGIRRSARLKGIIATSPWLRLSTEPRALGLFLARGLKIIAPELVRDSKLDVNYLSHDRNIIEQYEEDSLIHRQITPSLFFNARKAGERAIKEISGIKLPVLLMHGTGDKITSFKASEELVKNAKDTGVDIRFISWDGLYHELHHEYEKDEVFRAIMNWVSEKSKKQTL
ncbi:MAG: alpha/beta hydrolase [Bacteroidota bacterium]